MPDDLPDFLEFRVGCVGIVVLPRREEHPTIPLYAEAWRLARGPWRETKELPAAWRAWLERGGH